MKVDHSANWKDKTSCDLVYQWEYEIYLIKDNRNKNITFLMLWYILVKLKNKRKDNCIIYDYINSFKVINFLTTAERFKKWFL